MKIIKFVEIGFDEIGLEIEYNSKIYSGCLTEVKK
jgi:hypothetical protein